MCDTLGLPYPALCCVDHTLLSSLLSWPLSYIAELGTYKAFNPTPPPDFHIRIGMKRGRRCLNFAVNFKVYTCRFWWSGGDTGNAAAEPEPGWIPSMVDIRWGIVRATTSPTVLRTIVLRTIAWNCVTVVGTVEVVDGTNEGERIGRRTSHKVRDSFNFFIRSR